MNKPAATCKTGAPDNSRPLDLHGWSDHPQVDGAVDALYAAFQSLPGFSGKEKIQRKHIKVVILDLFAQHEADPEGCIVCSRVRGRYQGKGRYNLLGITFTVVAVIDALHHLGFLETVHCPADRSGSTAPRASRIRATEKLIDLMVKEHHVTSRMAEKAPYTECIILLASERQTGRLEQVPYQDTPETRRMRGDLYRYNNLLRRTFIDIPIIRPAGGSAGPERGPVIIDRHDRFIRRIFRNGSWDGGGRFCGGWWCKLPGAWRLQIQMDRSPVVEAVFAGLPIVILYALAGINYWKAMNRDPYRIAGLEHSERMGNLLRLVLSALMHARSGESLVRAVREEISLNPGEYGWAAGGNVELEEVIGKLCAAHSPISGFLLAGRGLNLRNVATLTAEYVIGRMTREEIPVLCLPDAYIVQIQHRNRLHQRMREGFRQAAEKLFAGSPDMFPGVGKISFLDTYWDGAGWTDICEKERAAEPESGFRGALPELTVRIDDSFAPDGEGIAGVPETGDLAYRMRYGEHKAIRWERDYYREQAPAASPGARAATGRR